MSCAAVAARYRYHARRDVILVFIGFWLSVVLLLCVCEREALLSPPNLFVYRYQVVNVAAFVGLLV